MKWCVMCGLVFCAGLFSVTPGFAQQDAPSKKSSTVSNTGGSLRSKSIDFEGEVVEGLNKNPLDALEHTATKDKGDKGHLYRKKEHFRPEMKQLVRDMGFKR